MSTSITRGHASGRAGARGAGVTGAHASDSADGPTSDFTRLHASDTVQFATPDSVLAFGPSAPGRSR